MSTVVKTQPSRTIPTQNNDENDDEYDPYLHRVLSHPNTSFETFSLILKDLFGAGIFHLPLAIKYAGFIHGIISIIIIAIFNTYIVHVLCETQYTICKRKRRAFVTYPESMEFAFEMGPKFLRPLSVYFEVITGSILTLYHILVCSLYILLFTENLRDVTNYFTGKHIWYIYIILMCIIPFSLIASVPNLKIYAPFSIVGNIVNLFTYSMIIYHVSQNYIPLKDLKMVGNYLEYRLFVCLATFALQTVSVATILENNMARPVDFRRPFGVLNIAMFCVTIVHILIGILGYRKYGENIKSSIIRNIRIDTIVGQTLRIMYPLTIFISYGLNLLIAADDAWECFIEKRLKFISSKRKVVLNYSVRFICVVITCIIALSIPFLGPAIACLDTILVTILLLIFPATMEICVYWSGNLGHRRWKLWKNYVIIIVGLNLLIFGIIVFIIYH